MEAMVTMVECLTCGREYPSPLDAALCGEADSWENEDRRNSVIFRSID